MTPDQRQARLRHHMYETNEGIAEQSEHIVRLEELCADMWYLADGSFHYVLDVEELVCLLDRMGELGVEVDE